MLECLSYLLNVSGHDKEKQSQSGQKSAENDIGPPAAAKRDVKNQPAAAVKAPEKPPEKTVEKVVEKAAEKAPEKKPPAPAVPATPGPNPDTI